MESTQTETSTERMSATEFRAASSLGAIFALRMLGLFMILPVFALYAHELEGHTEMLTGLAIGAYGLTQALLQIPFGMLSDRIGRKRVIVIGLVLFAIGSLVAAVSDSIWGVILGRALQGAGAIAAAVMALLADLTREEHRAKAMAIFGGSIGMAFTAALILGPLLGVWLGVNGIFWLTGLLALAGIFMTLYWVPKPAVSRFHRDTEPVPAQFGRVLADRQLLRLDFGILVMHMLITATFVALPLVLRDVAGVAPQYHWWIYLPVLVVAIAAMVPFLIVAEKRGRMKEVFLGAVVLLAVAELGLAYLHANLYQIVPLLILFFLGFNILEATLPSLVSKIAPADSKGTAMGVYSSSQFLGAFMGGVIGGWMLGEQGSEGVFLFGAAVVLVWLAVAAGMRRPGNLRSRVVRTGEMASDEAAALAGRLAGVTGVVEAVVIGDEGVAYLKVDRKRLDERALAGLLSGRRRQYH